MTQILVPICLYCLKWRKFDKLFLREVIIIDATRCLDFSSKCMKCVWRLGSARTRWGSLSAPPDSLATKRGPTSKGRGGKGRRGRGEEKREGRGRVRGRKGRGRGEEGRGRKGGEGEGRGGKERWKGREGCPSFGCRCPSSYLRLATRLT